ncbi:MAG: ABC transporter ATP-binding protein [Acholeplasmatales bacterium]|nr:ABC transporter ATP-binding protein [Acholeplasmatales bacterium]
MIGLLKYLKKLDWFLILIGVGLIVLQVYLELKMPDYTAKLTTIVQSQQAKMYEVWKNGGLMLACAGGSLAASIVCSILISRVSSSFSRTIRDRLFKRVVDFSDAEIKEFSVPSLITRTTNDVMQVQMFMAMGVQLLFKAPIMAIWAIFKISNTNVQWTTAVLISVLIIAICVGILIAVCFPRFKRIQKLTDDINNVTRENISGIRVVRAFNAEEYQENKFEDVNSKITRNHLVTSRTMGVMNPVMTIVLNGLTLSIYWIGAILINDIAFNGDAISLINERIELVGDMAAFTQYAMQVIMSFMMLIMIFIILPRTMVSGNRILEVLKTESSIKDGDYKHSTELVGQIEFRNVSFSYPDGDIDEKVLSDISFKIKKGETLAIIGATGSAKTTLINLIPRFYDATKGEVLVNGINVKDYKEVELRSKISIAAQKAVLFKGTVKDNITYGANEINEDRINKAIEISQAGFVLDLEHKLESEVAQGGTNFSGGQKQRLSIARAIYKDSEILIFDDTFSALDYKTDMLVRKSIKENLDDKTVIIVAQRIGTIKDADNIIVLDEGRIVGEGKHKKLLEECKIYKEIALSQLSKEEL